MQVTIIIIGGTWCQDLTDRLPLGLHNECGGGEDCEEAQSQKCMSYHLTGSSVHSINPGRDPGIPPSDNKTMSCDMWKMPFAVAMGSGCMFIAHKASEE